MARTLPWLGPDPTHFPPVETAMADPNGLLAAGGDLSPARLLAAYGRGIFPWYSDGQPVLWWSPDPRCVILPHTEHCSRRLRRLMRQCHYETSFDEAFDAVIANCRLMRHDHTWITTEMEAAYNELRALGHAHSVEVWRNNHLVGGLYGVAIGRCFFGESMYSAEPNASKIALVTLCEHLWNAGFAVFDCQVTNPHLLSMGAREIPRDQFLAILRSNIDQPAAWPS